MPFCVACGAKFEFVPKFCPECGRKFTGDIATTSQPAQQGVGMENDQPLLVVKREQQMDPETLANELRTQAYNQNWLRVKQLLDYNPELDKPDKNGCTALDWACNWGHVETVNALIAKGANINNVSNRGYTPLHTAAANNRGEVITILLKAKADPGKVDKLYGDTPLGTAKRWKKDAAAKALAGCPEKGGKDMKVNPNYSYNMASDKH